MKEIEENKEGFKKTKLGWIPEDWEIISLGDIGEAINGLTYSPKDIDENGVLVLRSSNVQNGQIVLNDNVHVNVEEGKFNKVIENDILICVRNGSRSLIGKNTIIPKVCEGMAFGAFMSIYRSLFNQYITHLLKTDMYNKEIHKNLGATINSINGSDLKKFQFPFPPEKERVEITKFLSTWDRAISDTQKLIEQLKLRKKGLMQQLLTGKKRLPGFDGDWEEVRLGEILEEYKEKSTLQDQHEVLTSSRKGLLKQSDYFGDGRITSRKNVGFHVIPPNYITYRSRSDDGKFKFNLNNTEETGIISHYYPVFKMKNNCNGFFIAFSEVFNHQFYRNSVGTSQIVLSMNSIKKIKGKIPSTEEQRVIENILSKSQEEIEIQEQKHTILTSQKEGIMQQLLTGQKRVKI